MILPVLSALLTQGPTASTPSSGPPYWQQEVRYQIQASLDEPAGVLAGTERIVYVNHSPDTLTTFSLHLHLNAFRPGSRWADADSAERKRRFNDLKDPDYGFNHVRNARIMGEAVRPTWPFAPDSTIVRYQLPRPLQPGDTMAVDLEWDARPSTVPRRQGRRGRAFDFAQWYPKVVVYDRHGWEEHPLYPGGEFYGEFATYLVDLDVPADQVMGATGVPICGDPGWERANQAPDKPVEYQRGWYQSAPFYTQAGNDCFLDTLSANRPRWRRPAEQPGRKRVVWYAENVHHFALSLNPEYRYEGGKWGDVVIHVLYQPGDEKSWGARIAVARTATALAWLDAFYGKFAWPQITNLHRIEGGGTEFPMVIMDGSPSQGLIVHELGHNYTMGILANNEWREAWLDEGFTSFQTSLFGEATQPGSDSYAADEPFLTGLDLDGLSEPASLVSEDYRDFNSYNISVYNRGELFFHQLRYIVGDAALLRIMRTFYQRWTFKHVDEAAFREVAEEVSGQDLSTFFAQALHGTVLVDYAVGRVRMEREGGERGTGNGKQGDRTGWSTRVEVVRKAEGRLPLEVWVLGESDTAVVRTDGVAEREWVTVGTRSRPKQVLLDPRLRTRDWNMLNNTWRRGFLFASREPARKLYLDTGFSQKAARDRRVQGLLPTIWYNNAAGITLGVRSRENYFDRFSQITYFASVGTGWGLGGDPAPVRDQDFLVRVRNPTWLRSSGLSETLEAYNVEGRFGARVAVERTAHDHLFWGPVRTTGLSVTWLQPDDMRYLDRGFYENAGTVELALSGGVTDRRGPWELAVEGRGAGGLVYNRSGLAAVTGRAVPPFYGRFTLTGKARRSWPGGLSILLRGYAGVTAADAAPVKQRQIYLAGADPLERFDNPLLRSDGAVLAEPDVRYHAPGGGDLRGFLPQLSVRHLVAVNLELERTVFSRARASLFRRVAFATFGDMGYTFGETRSPVNPYDIGLLADAGLGLRAEHRIGQTVFVTRADVPIYVSRPALSLGSERDRRAAFRWVLSFSSIW